MEKKIGSNGLDCFAAFCVSFVLFAVEVFNLANYGTGYDAKLICIAGGFFVFWFFLFAIKSKLFFKTFNRKTVVCIILLSICLGIYFANVIWGGIGYVTLDSLGLIVSGEAHIDNLYHSSIAAGYLNYGYSTLLVNFPSFLRYHTFSHLVFGLVSKLTGIPTYFVYSYVFAVLYLPLFIFLIINVINSLLQVVSGKTKGIGLKDFFIVALYIIGIFPTDFYWDCAIFITTPNCNESLMLSHVLLLMYLRLLIQSFANENPKMKKALFFALNPLFIFLCTFAKVSTGFLLAAGLMYYVFRKHTESIKYWLLNLCYFCVFIASYFFVSSPGGDSSNGIHLLDFVRSYSTPSLWVMHYLIYFFVIGCFLSYRLSQKKLPNSIKALLTSKDFILEEIILVASILGALPGFLLHIGGGSASLFELPVRLVALLLFCGFDCSEFIAGKIAELKKIRFLKYAFFIYVFSIMAFNMGFENLAYSSLFNRIHYSENNPEENLKETIKGKLAKKEKDIIPYCWNVIFGKNKFANTSFYKNIIAINKITQGHKKEYAMFVDDTAELWEIYKDITNRKTPFVYPAITNILCLNEVYCDDEYMYNRPDTISEKANYYYYGYQTIRKEPKKSFSQVCLEAKDMGYKKIIRLYEDKFEVLDLY